MCGECSETTVAKTDDGAVTTVEAEEAEGGPEAKRLRQEAGEAPTTLVKATEEFPSLAAAVHIDWAKKANVGKARRLPSAYFVFKGPPFQYPGIRGW